VIVLADEHLEMDIRGPKAVGGTPVALHVYVEDADSAFERAIESGRPRGPE
jgi:PhnB protein